MNTIWQVLSSWEDETSSSIMSKFLRGIPMSAEDIIYDLNKVAIAFKKDSKETFFVRLE